MQIAIVFAALVAVALANPVEVIPVLERHEVRDEVGQYALSYLSGDGTSVSEQGALKPTADGLDNVLVKQGSYAYTAPDGLTYKITWVADENGFQASGDHIPVGP